MRILPSYGCTHKYAVRNTIVIAYNESNRRSIGWSNDITHGAANRCTHYASTDWRPIGCAYRDTYCRAVGWTNDNTHHTIANCVAKQCAKCCSNNTIANQRTNSCAIRRSNNGSTDCHSNGNAYKHTL